MDQLHRFSTMLGQMGLEGPALCLPSPHRLFSQVSFFLGGGMSLGGLRQYFSV